MAVLLLAWVVGACTSTSIGQTQVAGAAGSDETLYVVCGKLPVHVRPSGFSPVIATTAFGRGYAILEAVGYYKPRNKTFQVPAWARIALKNGQQGYVSARCLVQKSYIESQRALVAARTQRDKKAEAGRGFSEDLQDEEIVSVRGARGKARSSGGAANYQAVDRAVRASPSIDAWKRYRKFRQRGVLGEFFTTP